MLDLNTQEYYFIAGQDLITQLFPTSIPTWIACRQPAYPSVSASVAAAAIIPTPPIMSHISSSSPAYVTPERMPLTAFENQSHSTR